MIYHDATGLAETEKPLTEKQTKRYAKSLQKGGKATDKETGIEF